MGKSKCTLAKQKKGINNKIAKLEEKVKKDPLKRLPELHDELAKLKSKLNKLLKKSVI